MSSQARPNLAYSTVLVLALLQCGCMQRYLVATPNVLHNQDPQLAYAGTPEVYRKPEMEILYATDRAPLAANQNARYGSGRSTALAYGTATVSLSSSRVTWGDLARDSTLPARENEYTLKLAECRENGRLEPGGPASPTGLQWVSTNATNQTLQEKPLHDLIRARLATTSHKDVFLFVHGFNNSFDDAVFRAGEVWHFMGRVGVPIAYTWPAGRGGLFGYAYDRESGEFTVTHLKHFLRAIASCPDVQRVHVIAHSRGSDVAITALRELNIGYQAQGKVTRQELKLENLVLAAPDLDEDVFVQRFVAEDLLGAAGRTTVYCSRHDRALEVADYVFGSRKRVGTLGPRDFSPNVRQKLAHMPNLQFIECQTTATGYALNHDYIFANPGALSDLILVLRDRRGPGAANGRPLRQPVDGVWELDANYPLAAGQENVRQ
jgi:esterase/lipase superfamily enzyme